jgi:hypothetical protein
VQPSACLLAHQRQELRVLEIVSWQHPRQFYTIPRPAMCNKCFNGLWCLDEKQQYDKFITGFTKTTKRYSKPAPIVISINATESKLAQQESLKSADATKPE